MIGLIVKCDLCGTERPDVVYYVGKQSTHCVNCWLSIIQAVPNFNIPEMVESIAEEIDNKTVDVKPLQFMNDNYADSTADYYNQYTWGN